MSLLVWTCFLMFAITVASIIPDPNQRILSRIFNHINDKEDPCRRFTKYAFGFDDEFFEDAEEDVNIKFQNLFMQLKDGQFEKDSLEQKVGGAYNICLSSPDFVDMIPRYLEMVLPALNTTWPHLATQRSPWLKDEFQWLQTLAKLRRFGVENLLFRMNMNLDTENKSEYLVVIGSQMFQRPDHWMQKNRFLKNMPNDYYLREFWQKLNVSTTYADTMTHKMRLLETHISQLANAEEFSKGRFSVQELERDHGIALGKYLEIVFGRPFSSGFEVQVENLEYLIKLKQLLDKYEPEVVANYMMERFVAHLKHSLGRPLHFDLSSICTQAVRISFHFASQVLYEEHVLGQQRIQEYRSFVQRTFEAIRQQFAIKLATNSLNLTDQETNETQKMLDNVTPSIGILPIAIDHRRFVTDFYKDLQIGGNDNFPLIHLKTLELRTSRFLKQLEKPSFEKNDLFLKPRPRYASNTITPIILGSKKTVSVYYEMLREPLFDMETHDVFRVSSMGIALGHDFLSELYPKKLPWKQLFLMNLNLLMDAYFARNSGFNQIELKSSKLTLKQLFLVNVALTITDDQDIWSDLTTLRKAFPCQ